MLASHWATSHYVCRALCCAILRYLSHRVHLTRYCTEPSQHAWKKKQDKILSTSQSRSVLLEHCLSELVNPKVQHWQFFDVYVHTDCVHCSPNSVHSVFLEGLLLLYSACQNLNNLFSPFVCFWKKRYGFFYHLKDWDGCCEPERNVISDLFLSILLEK